MATESSGKGEGQISFKVCEKEYESPELTALLSWFKIGGWSSREINWGVAGSQEVSTHEVTKGHHSATLVFETYQGVVLITSPESAELFNEIIIST